MLRLCMREADTPQVAISTTPKPLPHVKRLVGRGRALEKNRESGEPPRVVLTQGHMWEDDANLNPAARTELEGECAGTRLDRQQLSGELLVGLPDIFREVRMTAGSGSSDAEPSRSDAVTP